MALDLKDYEIEECIIPNCFIIWGKKSLILFHRSVYLGRKKKWL